MHSGNASLQDTVSGRQAGDSVEKDSDDASVSSNLVDPIAVAFSAFSDRLSELTDKVNSLHAYNGAVASLAPKVDALRADLLTSSSAMEHNGLLTKINDLTKRTSATKFNTAAIRDMLGMQRSLNWVVQALANGLRAAQPPPNN